AARREVGEKQAHRLYLKRGMLPKLRPPPNWLLLLLPLPVVVEVPLDVEEPPGLPAATTLWYCDAPAKPRAVSAADGMNVDGAGQGKRRAVSAAEGRKFDAARFGASPAAVSCCCVPVA